MGRILDSSGKQIEPEPINQLLSMDLFKAEWDKIQENHAALERIFKVAELRKSCGVKPEMVTISIRRPPRYASRD